MKQLIIMVAILVTALNPGFSQQAQTINAMETSKKQFSLLVRVPTSYTPEQAKAVGPEWDDLLQKWKADGVYVISFAFPGQSFIVNGIEKEIKAGAIVSDGLRVVSNIVLRATTIEEACHLAKDCPILKYGGNVEVREIPKPLQVTVH